MNRTESAIAERLEIFWPFRRSQCSIDGRLGVHALIVAHEDAGASCGVAKSWFNPSTGKRLNHECGRSVALVHVSRRAVRLLGPHGLVMPYGDARLPNPHFGKGWGKMEPPFISTKRHEFGKKSISSPAANGQEPRPRVLIVDAAPTSRGAATYKARGAVQSRGTSLKMINLFIARCGEGTCEIWGTARNSAEQAARIARDGVVYMVQQELNGGL